MTDPFADLRTTLSYLLLDSPWDPSANSREHNLIRHLVEMCREWGLGDIDLEDLEAIFKAEVPNFDIVQWLAEADLL